MSSITTPPVDSPWTSTGGAVMIGITMADANDVAALQSHARSLLRRLRRELDRARVVAPKFVPALERNLERVSADFRAAIADAKAAAKAAQ